jgi:hypothetical protein
LLSFALLLFFLSFLLPSFLPSFFKLSFLNPQVPPDAKPSNAMLLVQDAGTVHVNGYYRLDGEQNGKPRYIKVAQVDWRGCRRLLTITPRVILFVTSKGQRGRQRF